LTVKDESYQKAITWMEENNKWGASAQIVSDFQDRLNSGIGLARVECQIGWGLTKSGTAYEIQWIPDNFIVTELSSKDAEDQGFEEMSMICTVYH